MLMDISKNEIAIQAEKRSEALEAESPKLIEGA
jgi:hypothetical protein